MSSRYVWEVYDFSYQMTYSLYDGGDNLRIVTSNEDYVFQSDTCSFSSVTGRYTLTGDVAVELVPTYNGAMAGKDPAAAYLATGSSASQKSFTNVFQRNSTSGNWWYRGAGGDAVWIYHNKETRHYTAKEVKGEFLRYVTSAAFDYPNDGPSGGYWYDSLMVHAADPSNVAIPQSITGGETIQIVVTENTNSNLHKYGTISYDYQYRLNGGSWQTLTRSTDTTESLEIPAGTTSVQVRVRVRDNLGFISEDWVASETVEVFNNQPPGAPGSITASNVVSGRYATITLTSASDPDGYIANYIYERSIDGGSWQQIATSGALSIQDQVSEDWATVQYRACAVDNNGAQGPYVTGQLYTLNTGYIMIAGPDGDLGTRRGPFGLSVTIGVSGESGGSVTDIAVTVTLDGGIIYSGVRDAGEDLTVLIDTRFLKTGSHTIQIVAEKGGAYMPATAAFVFDVPVFNMSLLDGARAGLIQNSLGEGKLPYTLAPLVIVDETGKTLADVLEDLAAPDEPETPDSPAVQAASGTYTGAGTYGSNSWNSLTFDFEPELLIVMQASGTSAGHASENTYPFGGGLVFANMLVWTGQPGAASNQDNVVSVSGGTVRWYGASAAAQLNTSGTTYYYFAAGRTGA